LAILRGSVLLSHAEEQLEEMTPQHLTMMLVGLGKMQVRVTYITGSLQGCVCHTSIQTVPAAWLAWVQTLRVMLASAHSISRF
jgi:hypothetical protein